MLDTVLNFALVDYNLSFVKYMNMSVFRLSLYIDNVLSNISDVDIEQYTISRNVLMYFKKKITRVEFNI